MTGRQLLEKLKECDNDVLDYDLYTVATIQLGRTVRITAHMQVMKLNENVDVGSKKLFLKSLTTPA